MVKATRKKNGNLRGGRRGGVGVNLKEVTKGNADKAYVLVAEDGQRFYAPNPLAAVAKAINGQGGVSEPKLKRGQISGVSVNLTKVAEKDPNPYVLTAEDGTEYFGASPTEAVKKAVKKEGGVPPPSQPGYGQRISGAFGAAGHGVSSGLGALRQRFTRKNAGRAARGKRVPRPRSVANPPAVAPQVWTGTSVNKNVGSALGPPAAPSGSSPSSNLSINSFIAAQRNAAAAAPRPPPPPANSFGLEGIGPALAARNAAKRREAAADKAEVNAKTAALFENSNAPAASGPKISALIMQRPATVVAKEEAVKSAEASAARARLIVQSLKQGSYSEEVRRKVIGESLKASAAAAAAAAALSGSDAVAAAENAKQAADAAQSAIGEMDGGARTYKNKKRRANHRFSMKKSKCRSKKCRNKKRRN